MTVSLMQLRRQVRSRIGVPSSDGFQDGEVLDDSINQAVQTLESEQRWPWHEAVGNPAILAGASSFAVPADWRATRSLFIGDDELFAVAPADLYQRDITQTGQPEVFAVINNSVELRPVATADVTFTHLYYRTTALLVDDDDTLLMPDQFSGAVIAKAAELLSFREDDRAAASAHLAEYLQWVQRIRRDVRRTTGPVRVRVREGSWI